MPSRNTHMPERKVCKMKLNGAKFQNKKKIIIKKVKKNNKKNI